MFKVLFKVLFRVLVREVNYLVVVRRADDLNRRSHDGVRGRGSKPELAVIYVGQVPSQRWLRLTSDGQIAMDGTRRLPRGDAATAS